ncbi:hypothetical protein ACHHYP_12685 [Achlya hypogyna]|uniref:Nucleolar pre-ribosomal-associated protein 1 C-terminal domain-containing protein n=1 Tax=Achlya hypogyna TaxID=1202772 RepID=A0A1V9ZGP8_ACHHY|nr:hypothetical protein ACHHYP_12685 [Achlya hypogyna]
MKRQSDLEAVDASAARSLKKAKGGDDARTGDASGILRDLLLNIQKGNLEPLQAALWAFHAAIDFDCPAECSVLQAFVDISPRADQLVDLWGGSVWAEDRQRELFAPVMEILTAVMQNLRAHNVADAEALALVILKSKMENISKQLTWSDKPRIEYATLTLCTQMVATTSRVARDFVRLFDFNAKFFAVLNGRRAKVHVIPGTTREISVRHGFIQLVLALTTSPDEHVYRFMVKADGTAHGLFKSIDGDTAADVALILDTLEATVLTRTDVVHKHNVFSMAAISQLLRLLEAEDTAASDRARAAFTTLFFAPNALYHVSQVSTLPFLVKKGAKALHLTETDEAPTSVAADIVTKVLRSFNISASLGDPKRESLLLEFLGHYPGLVLPLFEAYLVVVQPRPSFKWFSAASFVLQALRLPFGPLESVLATHVDASCLEGVRKLLLPVGLTKGALTKALQHTDLLVVFTTLNLLAVVMDRVSALAAIVSADVAKGLENELRAMLPPPEVMLTLCTKYRPAESDAATSKQSLICARALGVLRAYFVHLPLAMGETKFDVAKLLLPGTPPPCLLGPLLQVLRVAEPHRLAWVVSGNDAAKFQSLLHNCLSTQPTLATLGRHVVRRTLAALGVFGVAPVQDANTPHEIDVWLHQLPRHPRALGFFDQLVRTVTANPFACPGAPALSPVTRALLSYLSERECPLHLKVDDLAAATAYAVAVLKDLHALASSPRDLAPRAAERDPTGVVQAFVAACATLEAKAASTKPLVLTAASSIDALATGETVELTEALLVAIVARDPAFRSVEQYFGSHASASLFDSSAFQKAFGKPPKKKNIVHHALSILPVRTVLQALFGAHVLLRGAPVTVPETARLQSYLQRRLTSPDSSVALAALDLVHSLAVYLGRLQQGLTPTKAYSEAATSVVVALHVLLLHLVKDRTKLHASFWAAVWRHQPALVAAVAARDDAVLRRWAMLPYALAPLIPETHLPRLLSPWGAATPLAIAMATHASPVELHELLDGLLAAPHNATLVLHLLELSQAATVARPGLFEKVAAFAAGRTDATAPKRWMHHFLQHHPVTNDELLLALFDGCWAAPTEIHVQLMRQLVRNNVSCRRAFEGLRARRLTEDALPAVLAVGATYLQSAPVTADCASWIRDVIVPSCIDAIMADDTGAISTAALIDVYSTATETLPADLDWLSDLVQNKARELSPAQLQVLLLAVQHHNVAPCAFKLLQFMLHQLGRSVAAPDAATDALAFIAETLLVQYGGSMKKLPAVAVQSFVKALLATDAWVAVPTLLGLVKTIAVVVPQVDLAPLATAVLARIASLELSPELVNAIAAMLATSPCGADVVNDELLSALLARYCASLSAVDCALKGLFELLESTYDVRLEAAQYCFGKANHATAAALSSHRQHWLLEEIEPARMRKSIEYFPLSRPFIGGAFDEAQECDVYDPAFFLPLVAHALSTSHIPDKQMLQSGILGYAICALSAEDATVREYAYGIVASAHEAMSATARSTDFNERRQIHLLLETLKNGIRAEHERLPSLLTVFANDAIAVLLRPGHAMYPLINAFLLARSALDTTDVPMFYTLFNSSASTYRQERSWLLHIIKRGVRLNIDVDLLQRRHVYAILLSFFDSPLADAYTRDFVLHILSRSVATSQGVWTLVHKFGLFGWLEGSLVGHLGSEVVVTWLVTIAKTSLEAYDLPEKNDHKYRPNIVAQLKQLCGTLVHHQAALPTACQPLLASFLIQYLRFGLASDIGTRWFSLDIVEAAIALAPEADEGAVAGLVASCLERIPESPRALQFEVGTHARWGALVAYICAHVASAPATFPAAVKTLLDGSPGFKAHILQDASVHVSLSHAI